MGSLPQKGMIQYCASMHLYVMISYELTIAIRIRNSLGNAAYVCLRLYVCKCRREMHIQPAPSPYRQRAMAHWFSGYLFNGFRRIATHVPFVVPPIAIGTCFTLPHSPYSACVIVMLTNHPRSRSLRPVIDCDSLQNNYHHSPLPH